MGVASRFLMLLSTPFPLLTFRPTTFRLARHSIAAFSALPTTPIPSPSPLNRPRRRLLFSLRASDQIHAQAGVREEHGESFEPATDERRAWPEWSMLVDHVMAVGYGDRGGSSDAAGDEVFEEMLEVPEDFARSVRACLSFAYDRPTLLKLMPKKDIKVVVDNGSPFLFKNSLDSVQRMGLFLNPEGSSVLQYEKVQTVDLVRYLMSYAHNHLFCSRGNVVNATEFVEASVRNLLKEMVNLSGSVRKAYFNDSTNRWSPTTFEQSSRSPRSDIEMKRGDWMCPKCNFMNFARNMKCLECDEGRPKRQLTGGEWECPQCDFFNYGRNMACLRCDCKRPGDSFSRTAPLEASFGNTRSDAEQVSSGNDSVSRSLDRILGKTSNISSAGNSSYNQVAAGKKDEITPSQRRDSNYVPFVPLPADMFKTPSGSNTENQSDSPSVTPQTEKPTDVLFYENSKTVVGSLGNEESSDPYKRTLELHDAVKSGNSISDDDFPEIMPMRKGENRFVVSKKKDRSLTSPQYKRRLAMEQANGSNFVPFVPFPPGYFSRKDNQPESSSAALKTEPANADSMFSESIHNGLESLDGVKPPPERISPSNPQTNQWSGNTESSGRTRYPDKLDPAHSSGDNTSTPYYNNSQKNKAETREKSNQPPFDGRRQSWSNDGLSNFYGNAQESNYSRMDITHSDNRNLSSWDNKIDGQNNGYPMQGNKSSAIDDRRSVPQAEIHQGTREGSRGKSLEGSAVVEPDPLDMSEEAKAQRWFRRVAQITDISELANIPDEDFPQIMPMRKGVNRFVVSKRKTPLERRLTSPQYRRNLPIVSSEPESDSTNQGKI